MELVIALVALITVAAVYAVVIWTDKPTPPDRPPSAPAALRIWNARHPGARWLDHAIIPFYHSRRVAAKRTDSRSHGGK